MKIHKVVAGTVIAGLMTAGSAGVAFADTAAPPSTPRPAAHEGRHDRRCDRAQERLEWLRSKKARVEAVVDWLQKARVRAEAAGRAELVRKIDALLAKFRHAHQRIEAAVDRFQRYCHVA
jgi:Spy/CpxP family protein refolding chaperone